MYYVITKRGGRGSAKCLLLLTWGEGGVKSLAYVINSEKKNCAARKFFKEISVLEFQIQIKLQFT